MGKASKRRQRALDQLGEISAIPPPEASERTDDDDDDNSIGPAPKPAAVGAFAALGSVGDNSSDSGEEEAEETVPDENKAKNKTNKTKKKKKKNKAAGAIDSTADQKSLGAAASSSSVVFKKAKGKSMRSVGDSKNAGDGLDEIDRALKALGVSKPTITASGKAITSSSNITALRSLLSIDLKMLDSDAELRRMFGSKVIAATPRSSPSHAAGYHARISNNPHHSINLRSRASSLARPTAYWPSSGASGGPSLSMSVLDPPPEAWAWTGEHVQSFEHNPAYRAAQSNFMQVVQTMDPNQLYDLLRSAPYHTDTLMQLSDVAAHQGDPGQAADFLDRALHAFERGFNGGFALARGEYRLDFSRVENRGFFRAIEKKVSSLAKRGCWRTACEFAKLLLGLDPYSDPYGALLLLDFLAPKAKQYTWFLEMMEVLPVVQDQSSELYLPGYPGLAYAKAFSLYHLELERKEDHLKSTAALRAALLCFPMVMSPLSNKAGLSLPAAFLRVPRSIPQTSFSDSPAYILHLQAQLYATRSADLWKEEGVKAWLENTAEECSEELEKGARSKDDNVHIGEMFANEGVYLADMAPAGILRNVFVSDLQSMRTFLPPGIQSSTSFSFDPLPPPDGTSYDSSYFSLAPPESSRQGRALPGAGAGGAAGRGNILETFMRRGREGINELIERIQVVLQADEGMEPAEREDMIEQLYALQRVGEGLPGGFPGEGRADDGDE